MRPIGIVILIQPAVLCLVLGVSLSLVGVSWLCLFRHFERRAMRVWLSIVAFGVAVMVFSSITTLRYQMPPMTLDWIDGL